MRRLSKGGDEGWERKTPHGKSAERIPMPESEVRRDGKGRGATQGNMKEPNDIKLFRYYMCVCVYVHE